MSALEGCTELMYALLEAHSENKQICDHACHVLRSLSRHRRTKSAIKKRMDEDPKLRTFKKQVFPSTFLGFRTRK